MGTCNRTRSRRVVRLVALLTTATTFSVGVGGLVAEPAMADTPNCSDMVLRVFDLTHSQHGSAGGVAILEHAIPIVCAPE